jgi:hypothetical protein
MTFSLEDGLFDSSRRELNGHWRDEKTAKER